MIQVQGFEHAYAEVNGTRLHYVIGGEGEPLVLMCGWPRDWSYFHKVMPKLAEHYRVIVVEIRGMGASAKPASGYDKKNMAQDVYELIRALGYEQAHIEGEDIGGQVAYSLAVNHPEVVKTLIIGDGAHPNDTYYQFAMVQPPEARKMLFPWWWVMAQVVGDLPEKLLAGRFRHIIDAGIDSIGGDDPSIYSEEIRATYAEAYDSPEAIRATNQWFETFYKDIEDYNGYPKLDKHLVYFSGVLMPISVPMIEAMVDDVEFVEFAGAGHFIAEERPEEFVSMILEAVAE